MSRTKGVSSVIAVSLIVAVVVALVGLVTVVVFDFSDSDETENSVAGASVDFVATQDGVRVTLLRSGDVEEFRVKVDGKRLGETLTEEGDSTIIKAEGIYYIIGRFEDGTEEVLTKKRVKGVIDGIFTVIQDSENNEAEAQVVERYQDSKYTISTDTSGSSDGSTTSFDFGGEGDDGRLLSRQNRGLLQESPDQLPDQATDVVDIGVPGEAPDEPIKIGEKAQLHELMGSWCKGDKILLVGEDGQTVIESDEFKFDYNCGSVQTISKYGSNGEELTGVKIINRWRQSANYSMYSYDGDVEPPEIGVANAGSLSFDVEVYQQGGSDIDTDSPIEGAEVVIGNKGGQTDADGSISFTGIPADEEYFITVNAGGFDGTQSPITAIGDGSGGFDSIKINGDNIEGDGQKPAPDDEGLYELDTSSNTLQIGIREFSPDIRTIKQDSVDSGNSITVDYDTFSISSGTQIALSTGSSGSDANTGGGDYDGGSISGGASFYSGVSTSTVQQVQTNSRVVREGTEYTPEPPNENITETEASTSIDDIPTRSLKVAKLDQDSIPTDDGAQIELKMSSQTYSEQQVEDTFQIYKAPVNDGSTGSLTPIDSVDVTLPPGNNGNPGNEVTKSEVITITSSDGSDPNEGAFEAGKEYVIYVALQSIGEPKEAGTLDVFNGALTDYTIDLNSSSTGIRRGSDTGPYDDIGDLSKAIVGDDLQITVDSVVSQTISTGNKPTVDLYRNGELVRRVQDYSEGQSFSYTEDLDEAQYVDYHVGIKESTETALLDTAIVQEVDPSSDTQDQITDFNAKLTLNDDNNICDSGLSSGNYDCTFKEGAGALNFDAGGTFSGADIRRQDVTYSLEFGNGRVVESKNYNSSSTATTDDYSETYSNSGTFLVQLTATFTDGNGNELSSVDTATVNVQKPADKVTGRFVGGINSSENFQLEFESKRSTTDEIVDIVIESGIKGASSETPDVSGSYKARDNFTLVGGVTESIELSVPEVANGISPNAAGEDESIAALTAENSSDATSGYSSSVSAGDVPLYVRVVDPEDSVSKLGPEGEQEIVVNPDGQIEANIQADVVVNPPITLSSTNDGDGTLSATYNDYSQGNSDNYEVVHKSSSDVVFSTEDNTNPLIKGGGANSVNPADSGTYQIKNLSDGSTIIRTVFVNDP